MKGSDEHLAHYEWSIEYQDFINRFEAWIDPSKVQSVQALYDTLHDWLGITKKGKSLPTQEQMDFFSEYYGQEYYDISAYEREVAEIEREAPSYEYRSGSLYNEGTKEFTYKRGETYEHYIAEEKIFNFSYGRRVVLIDSKTKKILAHHRDLKNEKYLGSQI